MTSTLEGQKTRRSPAIKLMAKNLQRRGWTISEIAIELGVPRVDIEHILYWELVLDAA